MTEVTPTIIDETTINKSKDVAESLLQQDGWSIVNELHAAALDTINQTGLFVLPVMANLDDYNLILKDPVGFNKRFETLSNDIAALMITVKRLEQYADGKKGKPTLDEIDTISKITLEYSRVHSYIELTIHPLILVLTDELEAVGINELTVNSGK